MGIFQLLHVNAATGSVAMPKRIAPYIATAFAYAADAVQNNDKRLFNHQPLNAFIGG